jgi:hypothetical protein
VCNVVLQVRISDVASLTMRFLEVDGWNYMYLVQRYENSLYEVRG